MFDNARQSLKGEELEGISSLQWLNHGRFELKGVSEPVEICEVRSAEGGALPAPTTSEKARRVESAEGEAVLGWRPAVGQVVPNTKWALEEKLGDGGFGEVWLGRHQTMKERRVFKFCFRADRVRSLKREMTLFRLIKERIGDHPNIVSLREVYFDQPPYYVEEDYVAGRDLANWCGAQGGADKVPLETKLEIVAQIADALQAAHDAGVIHRDVKPANILVEEQKAEGRKQKEVPTATSEPGKSQLSTFNCLVSAKLTDFGIGQVVSAECLAGVTQAGFTQTMLSSSSSHTGSQMYMAPELLAGKPASTRSDIYSLGVVLYQLLVGDFTRPVATDWAEDIPDPLLQEDVRRCVTGKPEDRFSSAAHVAERLRAIPQRRVELEQQAAEKRALEQAAFRRGMIRAAAIAGGVVLAMMALLAFGLNAARKARARALVIEQNAYASDMNLIGSALAKNNLGRARELLNRNRPQAGQRDLRDWEWRYLWGLCRSDASPNFFRHSNSVKTLAFSADNKWLAAGDFGGYVKVRECGSGREVASVSWPGRIFSVAFVPGGKMLAVAGEAGVGLIDPASGKEAARFDQGENVVSMTVSPDGRMLASLSWSQQVRVWDLGSSRVVASIVCSPLWGNHQGVLAFSPDNRLLAIGEANGLLRLIDVSTGTEKLRIPAHTDGVTAVCFIQNGKTLATGAGYTESTIKLWEASTGREIGRLEGHSTYISALTPSPDGATLASASGDQTIRLWDIEQRRQLAVLRGHLLEVWSAAFSADGKLLASGCKDGTIFFWDARAKAHEGLHRVSDFTVRRVSFSPDSVSLAAALTDGTVVLCDARTLSITSRLEALGGENCAVLFSPEGQLLVTGTTSGTLKVFNRDNQRVTTNALAKQAEVVPFQFLPGGHTVLTLEAGRRVWVVDVDSGTKAGPWQCDGLFSICAGNNGQVVVGKQNGQVELGDPVGGAKGRSSFQAHNGPVWVAVSSVKPLLATASQEGTAAIWDLATLRELARLRGYLLGVHSVAFSPDNRRLATGSSNEEAVKLWDVESHQEVLTLEGEGSIFYGVRFSPDGSLLMAYNERGILHLWRAPSWAEIEAAEKDQAIHSKSS